MKHWNERRVGGTPTLFHSDRRTLLRALAAGAASLFLTAHTPYGQWTVYRQRNLFIVASRTDEAALALARAIVEGFAVELPESRARVTRATDPVRIASLLATGQLDVAVISKAEASAMLAGSGEYRAIGPLALTALVELGPHLLVTTETFKTRHAFLLAMSVDHLRPSLPIAVAVSDASTAPPFHPGAAAYYQGLPAPDAAEAAEGSE